MWAASTDARFRPTHKSASPPSRCLLRKRPRTTTTQPHTPFGSLVASRDVAVRLEAVPGTDAHALQLPHDGFQGPEHLSAWFGTAVINGDVPMRAPKNQSFASMLISATAPDTQAFKAVLDFLRQQHPDFHALAYRALLADALRTNGSRENAVTDASAC